jgi:hypothetical protein
MGERSTLNLEVPGMGKRSTLNFQRSTFKCSAMSRFLFES